LRRFVWPVSKARRKAGQSKRRAVSLRFGQCGNIFAVLPGEQWPSPMNAMLSRRFFDKKWGFILRKDCTKNGFFSAMLIDG
jgi:hypothetical protein